MSENKKGVGFFGMKWIGVFSLLLLSSFAVHAYSFQSIAMVSSQRINSMALPLDPEDSPIPMKKSTPDEPNHFFESSHGPSQTFQEYVRSCGIYHNYDSKTKQWNVVAAKSVQECNQGWSNYIARSKIKFTTKDFTYTRQ